MSEMPKVRSIYEDITMRGFATVWAEQCNRYNGRLLVGEKSHWCPDFDYLPIDETCKEIEACTCKWKS